MQQAFDFGASDEIKAVSDRLRSYFGDAVITRRDPIGQLVKSMISARTRDEVSLAAYERLIGRYPGWSHVAAAQTHDVEAMIGDVTYSDVKARQLGETLRKIEASHPDFDLTFLGQMTVVKAQAWLETMPGVGPKVSASTLNFSTLSMPAFVVDTHVLRVLRRFGFVRSSADIRTGYDAVMASTAHWSATQLAELHVFMKHLGQTTCRADHARCRDCPICSRCKTDRQLVTRSLPGPSGRRRA